MIELVEDLARRHDRRITVRLVKGAYWDSEIKRAQELGLNSYPVFTRKEHTDISYLACARRLLEAGPTIYAQFATHNAHTAAAIVHMAGDRRDLEFQRLHGMSDGLHHRLAQNHGFATRTYAPVGEHKDLLPYLVRRLLENGANASFVNQLLAPDADLDTLSPTRSRPPRHTASRRILRSAPLAISPCQSGKSHPASISRKPALPPPTSDRDKRCRRRQEPAQTLGARLAPAATAYGR